MRCVFVAYVVNMWTNDIIWVLMSTAGNGEKRKGGGHRRNSRRRGGPRESYANSRDYYIVIYVSCVCVTKSSFTDQLEIYARTSSSVQFDVYCVFVCMFVFMHLCEELRVEVS